MTASDKDKILTQALLLQRLAYRDAEMGRKSWACAVGECYALSRLAALVVNEPTDDMLTDPLTGERRQP